MTSLIDVTALLQVAGISLAASFGVVVLFSIAVASTDLAAGDRPGGNASRAGRVLGRTSAAVALALCAGALIFGLVVMLRG